MTALLGGAPPMRLDRVDPMSRRWFEADCAYSATMVDRTVPTVNAAHLGRSEAAIGARLVADIAPCEAAKLRMLNGARPALAYLGLLAGHAHVHKAAASLMPASGQDFLAHAGALLATDGP